MGDWQHKFYDPNQHDFKDPDAQWGSYLSLS